MRLATQPLDCADGPGDEGHEQERERFEAASRGGGEKEAARLWRGASAASAAGHRHEALFLYEQAAPLFRAGATEGTSRAVFRAEFAALLASLGEAERRADYLDRALSEYASAALDFERAGDATQQAAVAHCLARLLLTLERVAEAHEQLDRAHKLLGDAGDAGWRARLDETRAHVLLAEGRNAEAEVLSRGVVEALEEGGASPLLAAALTAHGVALARLGRGAEAHASLRRAATLAARAGHAEAEGRAALALVEELSWHLPAGDLAEGFDRAVSRLSPTLSLSLGERLCAAARRVVSLAVERETAHSWEGFSFKEAVRRFEAGVIARALADAGGSVSRAAHLLGFRHHNSLASILNNRHRELLAERSPIKPRRRSIITVRERPRAPRFAGAGRAAIVLHVEDDTTVADAVRGMLEAEGCRVETCLDGDEALSRLQRTAPYDLLVLDLELPGVGGLELAHAVRGLAHRRALPIIVFSATDRAREALDAGADLFLRKPQDASTLSTAVKRLLRVNKQAGPTHPH
jgi:CheY-like chemotaxis protein/tetratricopeptide (TPR) repeat protein